MTLNHELRLIDTSVLALRSSWLRRALFGLFAVLLIALMIYAGEVLVIAAPLGLFCILAALYVNEWYFDPGGGVIRRRVGLLFLATTRTYSVDELERLVLVRTRTMRSRPQYQRLLAERETGKPLVIEIRRSDSRELENIGERIGQHLGVELSIDEVAPNVDEGSVTDQ